MITPNLDVFVSRRYVKHSWYNVCVEDPVALVTGTHKISHVLAIKPREI
jgi:hypothetical protein